MLMGCCGVLIGSSGCLSGSLATSSGGTDGGKWSIAKRQRIHVGETVEFSFVLKKTLGNDSIDAHGIADYCAFSIGGNRVEAEIDDTGGFKVEYTFADVEDGGQVEVVASAFSTQDDRDFMQIAGKWLQTESPYNKPDKRVAAASVLLTAYQSVVRFKLPKPEHAYDLGTGKMTFHCEGDRLISVFEHRPPRVGFEISEESADGSRWVAYLPTGDHLNPTGTTDVEFSIYDVAGNRLTFTDTLQTP
jgi:hypothetical protein